jgi:hypothetical protein
MGRKWNSNNKNRNMGWDQAMIIGLSGYARSGKDTAADHLISSYGFTKYSFAAPMKEAMYRLNPIVNSDTIGPFRYKSLVDVYGLDSAKESNPEIRRLLQVFGTEVGRDMFGENFWVDLTLNSIKENNVVISDVRFKNEADAIKSVGGQVWRINRHGVGPVTDHSSEIDLDNYPFDFIIDNDYSVVDLNNVVSMLLEKQGV